MPAPKKAKLPNYKFYKDNNDKIVFIKPIQFKNRIVGIDSSTNQLLVDKNNIPTPYKQINLPNWRN